MIRLLARKLPLALVTLFVLSLLVFFGGQLLPGDVGRAILGPLADPRAVAAFNHEVGVDRPVLTQYLDWIGHFVIGDMGTSYVFHQPVRPFVVAALINSLKLAGLAFLMIVPIGIAGGVFAALNAGRWGDRAIVMVGQSLGVVPEFISSILLILVFGVWLRWFPMSADWPDGSGALTQIHHLVLPALPLVIIYFGYMARVARAGMIEALDADYTRTAILKGISPTKVLTRHVLRNALVPSITVSASAIGYLAGGIVVVETLFHYQGLGSLIYTAARQKDFPMLEAGVLLIGFIYTLASILADLLIAALDPRLRAGAST
jgi:peptide/nickel transport system permease protein